MIYVYANYYFNFGFNITCITNKYNIFNKKDRTLLKSPSHKWSHFQKERQNINTLKSYEWDKSVGIGVVLGYDNLRALDIDGCENFELIYDFLETLNFPSNYKWVVESGSKKGFHILFYSDNHKFNLLKNKIKVFKSNSKYNKSFKHIELRWIGHLVLPPSIHPSSMNYQFINGIPLEEPSHLDLQNLYVFLRKYCSGKSLEESGVYIEDGVELSIDAFGDKIDEEDEIKLSTEYNNAPYYMFIDTETTGVPKDWNAPVTDFNNWPRLVQLAWLLYDADGKLISQNEIIVKPDGFSIPKEASDVHGITTEFTFNYGEDITDVLLSFEEQCYHAHYLIGHNINFDSKVMGSEFLRTISRNPISKKELLCTMESSTDYCQIEGYNGYKWPKLSELHIKLFGEDFEGAHDALSDIKATARCFWEMRKLKLIKTIEDQIKENPHLFSL